MSVIAVCPECQERFDAPDDGEPIRCPRCDQIFALKRTDAPAEGIQTKPAAPRRAPEPEDDFPRPRPRPPSTLAPILILAIGVLFFLLVFSIGFNAWFILGRAPMVQMERALRAEQMAMEQQDRAAQAAELAAVQERQAKRNEQEIERVKKNLQEDLAARQEEVDALKLELARLKLLPKAANVGVNEQQAWGTLEGRVVFKGALPKVESLVEKKQFTEDIKALLLKAPKDQLLDPTWRIDPKTKGVANVAIYIKRPANGMLPIHPYDKTRKDPVVLDAPFCVYLPHMTAVYPAWFDGKEGGQTGQKLVFKNSSPVAIAPHLVGHPESNPPSLFNLPAKQNKEFVLAPQKLPVTVSGFIHAWMRAYIWVFDHPYFAITKADGTFTIPRVPAGMEVQVMAWHESEGWLFTKDGKAMTLKAGKNTLDFEIGAN